MTTIPFERPTAQAKLEDLGYSYEQLCEILAGWEGVTAVAGTLDELTVDELWYRHNEADRHRREWADHKGRIVQELERRVKDAHPSFKPEDGGSREIVGTDLRLSMTYDRRYAVDEDVVLELTGLSLAEDAPLNEEEFRRLVRYKPEVNGTVVNTLARRGGVLADLLGRVRILTGATPKFEAKAR